MSPPVQDSFEQERDTLLASLDLFAETLEQDPARLGYSPAFGHNPQSYWARLHGVHLNHHYKQFGLLP